ncbi:hypothetical protein MJA45_09970 [Paenibacillus aurantius]|uniref:Uncharacterized protein n=1 Tax=Paenibacillus aurantius TaxID=2918900 RepID=A0AA96LG89_9BACL|nr:hypothetical protein [Paenibacillus aurantius]WJH32918.1 hypothetical protein N6H14_22065 [Paenibacillus sp. CC-CFT747]WNQ13327.1 hypothetical protein MJA45_09970 [Paenibacillus aurantius]
MGEWGKAAVLWIVLLVWVGLLLEGIVYAESREDLSVKHALLAGIGLAAAGSSIAFGWLLSRNRKKR